MTASSAPGAAAYSAAVRFDGMRVVRALFYLFVLWIPIETMFLVAGEGGAGGITIARLLGLLLFGVALIEPRRCFGRFPAEFWMIAWYFCVFTASQLWIMSELDTRFGKEKLTMIQMILLFLITVNLFADPDFRRGVLRFYGWWSSVVAAGMMLGAFGGQYGGLAGRSSIVDRDPNVAAGFFALGAICIAGDPRLFSSRWAAARFGLALLAIGALITAILQTGSRGGITVFVAGILGLALCGGKGTRARRLMISGAVAAALVFLIYKEFQHGTVTAARLDHAWNEGDTAGRTRIWQAAWGMFLERPLLGYGGINNLFRLGIQMNVPFRDTHNLLLAVLTEVGLVGAVPFVGAMLLALWKAWRYGRGTGDAMPFALMCGLFLFNSSLTGHHLKIFWIVLAAAAACGLERAKPA